ncbi:hypothetical protein ILP92_01870 [Maribius pontilimi]|uniref:NADH:quinone oxidoreductase/Mrp antiporter transmembrane domain-containing protein n=1 Tax=Palleronia pontilimi TaxID=1964209 RepID=A0A934I6S2_9RHOB|nr:proton-conducting transporter membrane subunit [Palleronia pontilimi]MBJ3761499.1 hypothetical protein [Palleronia pontilimi]
MAGAGDLIQLVMGMLLSSVTGCVLAAYHRDWEISLEAGMKYFLVGALVLVGLFFKLGALPAHTWVLDLAEGAPVPSAAFLTVVPKIVGAVALYRFVKLVPEDIAPVRLLVAIVAAATMTLGNLCALLQDDVRRLMGW